MPPWDASKKHLLEQGIDPMKIQTFGQRHDHGIFGIEGHLEMVAQKSLDQGYQSAKLAVAVTQKKPRHPHTAANTKNAL